MIKNTKFGKWELRGVDPEHVSSIVNEIKTLEMPYMLDANNPTKSLLEETVLH